LNDFEILQGGVLWLLFCTNETTVVVIAFLFHSKATWLKLINILIPRLYTGIPYKCQLKPDSGSCKAFSAQWFYNVTSKRCEVFVYGLCGGNENRFHTPQDCYRDCKFWFHSLLFFLLFLFLLFQE
jgi:hypothetical protein